MLIPIQSEGRAFNARVIIQPRNPVALRVTAIDPSGPNTWYTDRCIHLDNKDYELILKFPVSPQTMGLLIYNEQNGAMNDNSDPSFAVKSIKYEPVDKYEIWKDAETDQFLKFAIRFSQLCGQLQPGNPKMFQSNNGKFKIAFWDTIYDKNYGGHMTTPARIGQITGQIDVAARYFNQYTIPMRIVILLHEFAHKWMNPKRNLKQSNEFGADLNAIYVYLGSGFSELEAEQAFAYVFKDADNSFNNLRSQVIRRFIHDFKNGKIATKI